MCEEEGRTWERHSFVLNTDSSFSRAGVTTCDGEVSSLLITLHYLLARDISVIAGKENEAIPETSY